MIHRLSLITMLLFIIQYSYAQSVAEKYPTFKPVSPISHPMKFSGTFGELRSNHYHMGLDLKSERGRIGDKIFAIEDGYISRIKVEPGGYGQAVYIDHPQGLTSVYAHLEDFTENIKQMVRDSQSKHQTFQVDLKFDQADSINILTIKKGSHFAYMGTKGYSFGPHLHMEIRDTKTEIAINPLFFDFEYIDNVSPNIYYLLVHHYNDSYEEIGTEKISLTSAGSNKYRVRNGTIKSNTRYINFSVSSRDKMNQTPNNNGVYKLELSYNGKPFHHVEMDSVSFSTTRYLNAYIAYNYFKSHKAKLHRLHAIPVRSRNQPIRDALGIFKINPINPVIILNDSLNKVDISVSDFNGNKSTVSLDVAYEEKVVFPEINEYNYFLPYDEDSHIKLNGYTISIPQGALYEDVKLRLSTTSEKDSDCLSHSLLFHHNDIPLHKPMSIEYDLSNISDSLPDRLLLGNCGDNSISNQGQEISGNTIKAYSYHLASFCVLRDTTPPTIKVVQSYNLPASKSMYIYKVTDNISSSRFSESMKYEILLDGEYTYYELDAKSDRLLIPVSEMDKLNKKRVLSIHITDAVGNKAAYEHEFKY